MTANGSTMNRIDVKIRTNSIARSVIALSLRPGRRECAASSRRRRHIAELRAHAIVRSGGKSNREEPTVAHDVHHHWRPGPTARTAAVTSVPSMMGGR